MANRVYKLQEFVAHLAGVNCLNIGKKACRLLLTGGEDHKVNLWAVGKPTSLMSLCGHTSPVESVAFDSTEVLVLAGASTGAIKMWDLEETRMVRTLNGHRSYCTAVEFHPFAEFFASGSMDTNVRIWDIRKKGCVHTYKGHTGGINAVKFSPDGRWLVSGGLDNVVKAWDLTAGKLLHDFKSHEGHIRSIDFHPLEFCLATGSADKTIKFWDLESFELVGSSRAEASGVRCVTFHPDGSFLFCGRDDGLKVYSWEPVICHDTFDMGWSMLGDICINDGKLLACSYHHNSVGIWVADISFVKPYANCFKIQKDDSATFAIKERQIPEKEEDNLKADRFCCGSPEYETKEIKTIYVDTGGRTASLTRARSLNSSKVENLESRDDIHAKHPSNSRRESLASETFHRKIAIAPNHERKLPDGKIDLEKVSIPEEKKLSCDSSDAYFAAGSNILGKHFKVGAAKEPAKANQLNVGNINDTFIKFSLGSDVPQEINNGLSGHGQGNNSIKPINDVFPGRTRSLVEKFETNERQGAFSRHLPATSERGVTSHNMIGQPQTSGRELASADANGYEKLIQEHESFSNTLHTRLTKLRVVRDFWQRHDMKAAADVLLNVPDHSVQVDFITVISDKSEVLNLDIFSCLLPVLSSLLGSKNERHVKISTDAILKLVGIFGPVVRSTIQAPPVVGVDLQADLRRECCNKCFAELQKIQKLLPDLMIRGGAAGRCAQELTLVLKE